MISIVDVALERLSDSSCSEYELRLYLENEFISIPQYHVRIDCALNRLKELHLINDQRLATNLAQRYAHKGNPWIIQLLQQRGIAEETIMHVLSSLENENVRALDEARKKLGNQWDNSEKAMTLLHRFLSGRRFPYAVIKTVLGQLGEQRCSMNG